MMSEFSFQNERLKPPRIQEFQKYFTERLHELDANAEYLFLPSPHMPRMREEFDEQTVGDFVSATNSVVEFTDKQFDKRKNSSFGPITRNAAELIWRATRDDLQLNSKYPDVMYNMTWCPKFFTGVITGENDKNTATWRYHLSLDTNKPWEYHYIILQYNTDWSNWNKFKSSAEQNYTLQEIVVPKLEGQDPWKVASPQPETVQLMMNFLKFGKLTEIRGPHDAFAAAIGGGANSVIGFLDDSGHLIAPMTLDQVLEEANRKRREGNTR